MATEAVPRPPQAAEDVGHTTAVHDDRDVVDLTELSLRPAPEAEQVQGLLLVEVSARPPSEVPTPDRFDAVRFLALVLVGIAAPLLVLYGAVALPVAGPIQGAVLVAGWIVLGVTAKWFESRRRRR